MRRFLSSLTAKLPLFILTCSCMLSACDDPPSAESQVQIDIDAEAAELEESIESVRERADERVESADAGTRAED